MSIFLRYKPLFLAFKAYPDCGKVIKLLGVAKKLGKDKIVISVAPRLVKQHGQLGGTNDVFNAILVRGDGCGDVVFYGRGAGKLPTASAVVADVIDCGRHTMKRKAVDWADMIPDYIADCMAQPGTFYVRGTGRIPDFSDETILHCEDAPAGEVAFLTPAAGETALRGALMQAGFTPALVLEVTDY